MSADPSLAAGGSLRIDKWLWFTRFFKTRSLAAKAVTAGHVRVNGQRVKPSRDVTVGDLLTVQRDSEVVECHVLELPLRRGPAPLARSCWAETQQSAEKRAARALERRAMSAVFAQPTAGRPDKRTRRLLRERIRGAKPS